MIRPMRTPSTSLHAQGIKQRSRNGSRASAVLRNLGKKSAKRDAAIAPYRFKPGQSGNPSGKAKDGSTPVSKMSLRKAEILAKTGMTPLDFLYAVFRDELYADYEGHASTDGKVTIWVPRKGAKKLPVTMEHRLSAASTAAQYTHRKMPIALEGGDPSKPLMLIQAQALQKLSGPELEALLGLMNKLGVMSGFEGHSPATYDEDGKVAE